MKKYFWREKNAEKFIGKAKVYDPTKEELEKELVLKLSQKLTRIDVIFDKSVRDEYYLKDSKPKEVNLDGLSEEQIRRVLGMQVCVDFMQVICDLLLFYQISKIDLKRADANLQEIKIVLAQNIQDLQAGKSPLEPIQNILAMVNTLSHMLGLNFAEIEEERAKKEERQGGFLRGKYVEMD